jgi:hypothetical protein
MMGVAWLGPSRLSVLHDTQSVAVATNSNVRAILSVASKNTAVNSQSTTSIALSDAAGKPLI